MLQNDTSLIGGGTDGLACDAVLLRRAASMLVTNLRNKI
jgi:hypothetical protein